MEHAALQPLFRELGEEAFGRVQTGSGGWREMASPARMPSQSFPNLRMLTGSVVIDNGFDFLLGWNITPESSVEPDEFLGPMALYKSPDHGAVENIENSVVVPCLM